MASYLSLSSHYPTAKPKSFSCLRKLTQSHDNLSFVKLLRWVVIFEQTCAWKTNQTRRRLWLLEV